MLEFVHAHRLDLRSDYCYELNFVVDPGLGYLCIDLKSQATLMETTPKNMIRKILLPKMECSPVFP
jgi:hypothetical protein